MEDKEKLILAALLHDIGKFWQRAGGLGWHEELGDDFVKFMPPKFESIKGLIRYHHKRYRDSKIQRKNVEYLPEGGRNLKILIIADWLSSGEREELENEEIGKPKITPLQSIFSQINLKFEKGDNSDISQWEYPLNPLCLSDSIFPTDNKITLSEEDYLKLWNEFMKDINWIKDITNFNEYFHKLYYILQKYTWCIPSAVYKSKPDVSLFDHLKTTSAIADCLYDNISDIELNNLSNDLLEYFKTKAISQNLKSPKFSLIHGDISGVQNFIYAIKTKYAAKSLKGRSLFLVLLNEFIAEHILKKLELPITNLLYCGGGHFYILAPKISDEKLTDLRKDINKKLSDEFKTKLYLAIGKTDLCAKDFVDGSIAKKWGEVAEETGKQKLKRYKEVDDAFDILFSPSEEGGNKEICSICGNEDNLIQREDNKICKTCNSFIDFAEYLKEVQDYGNIDTFKITNNLPFLKQFNLLYDGVYSVTPKKIPFLNIPLGISMTEHGIKTFEQLAKDWKEEKEQKKHVGDEKLGILKMDVDNLGKIFTKGFDKKIFVEGKEKIISKATISRMSTLSRMMSLFFEGYLNQLIENDVYKNHIYLIYAGGDDTFIVGRWDKVIELSYNIYKDFREYTCKNKDITISAGIVIVSPKYPLKKSADKAKDMLDVAKQEDTNKNKVAIFNEALTWNIDTEVNDFEEVIRIKKILLNCIKEGASKQLIQRVKGFDEWLEDESKKRKYVRLLKYYLYRNFKKKEENNMNEKEKKLWNIIKSELIPIFDKILENNINKNKKDKYNIMCVPIAARMAELDMKND